MKYLFLHKRDSWKTLGRTFFIALCMVLMVPPVFAGDVSTTAQDEEELSHYGVGIELLGAGLYYSIFGSYRPVEHFAVNLGVSYIGAIASSSSSGTGSGSSSVGLFQVPVSVSGLLGKENHYFEVLAGADFAFASASFSVPIEDKTSASAVAIWPEIGFGYRYWPKQGGFQFRGTLYIMDINAGGSSVIMPFPGFSFGYTF